MNDGRQVNDLTINAAIIDPSNGPIVLPIRTNDEYVGRGFRLNFKQIQCEHAPPMATQAVSMENSGDGSSGETNDGSAVSSKIYKNHFYRHKHKSH